GSVQRERRLWIALLLAGAVGGVLGSLLSGSRGGWVGLPLVLLVLYRAYSEFISRRMKLVLPVVLVVAAGVLYQVPQLGVQQRVHAAFEDIPLFQQGDSDTSLGARFEVWKAASQLALMKPVFGWGGNSLRSG